MSGGDAPISPTLPLQGGGGQGDARGDRTAWRCRRGLLELDLWLGGFWAARRDTLGPDERAAFERLLSWSDMEILDRLKRPRASGDATLDRLVQRIHDTPIPQ